ncbi:MAG: M15 family metallopeptidase [Acidimicrobiia bacterium]|nr:M15 family metallopeptidase [Acidimicrobiia bacterium]
MRNRTWVLALAVAGACAPMAVAPPPTTVIPQPIEPSTTSTAISTSSTTTTISSTTTTTLSVFARPAWLGTRPLPLRPDGHGEALPTPPELVDRQLETRDLLPPPAGDGFEFTLGPVPDDVLARSSWTPDCPVTVEELSYLTLAHYGFDGLFHSGEMIVNAAFADEIVEVFRTLHKARFPIEQMRVIAAEEIDAHPTGDWNDTTSFVCRPAVGSNSWSQHAFGLAIDINPFHNPYVKGDLVLPELASAYVDRADVRPGMVVAGDVVTEAFDAIGWGWGGRWSTLKDWMHFSHNGR